MGLLNSIDIGAKALKVHGKRIDVHAKNIANIDTPNYVRKIPVLNSTDDLSFHGVLNSMKEDVFAVGTLPDLQGGVTFSGIVEDPTLGEKIYKPGHPDADENGYIRASNVNAMVDIADALMAQRAYEANLALINITKSMASRAIDIGRS
ncbi:flagellar basal body rod protein FlgC [bacterium]|nr:flagellar basal body rod protein FlgC [bacterium]